MAHDPWLESPIVRSSNYGKTVGGAWVPFQVDANGALSVNVGGSGGGVVTVTPETNATWETVLLNDTVVLQAEIQENTAPPGMTTVLVTGGLDRARVAKNHALDAGGRMMVSVKGTVAPRWSASRSVGAVAAATVITAIKHKGNINGVNTTLLAYLDSIGALVEVGAHVEVILNPTLTGTTWADMETAASFMQQNTNAAIARTAATGRVIYGVDVGANKGADSYGMSNVDVSNYAITLNPNDVLVFIATPASSSGLMRVTANWHEAP
jgi:hypothetical protein